ncbi:hypothetical protein [Bradyrhizobium sp. CER78]|uniref:hypothetical protein n=1 Tax=Bradyrhizobium sp. CER78 TaxID=3039162 RepID=UPI002449B801|nr:hypothetical protein [Bradyrhizobium sp. CER78]MDH2381029.1 hypothetical protein [Bradyrhizobium sp. CER78]
MKPTKLGSCDPRPSTFENISSRAITEPRSPHHNRWSGEYRNDRGAPFTRAAHKGGDDDMEILMSDLWRLGKQIGLAAILSAAMATSSFAQSADQEPNAYASNETATRPWSAPVGHRQPRAADIPAATSASQQIIDQEDAIVDRKIRGICRGC